MIQLPRHPVRRCELRRCRCASASQCPWHAAGCGGGDHGKGGRAEGRSSSPVVSQCRDTCRRGRLAGRADRVARTGRRGWGLPGCWLTYGAAISRRALSHGQRRMHGPRMATLAQAHPDGCSSACFAGVPSTCLPVRPRTCLGTATHVGGRTGEQVESTRAKRAGTRPSEAVREGHPDRPHVCAPAHGIEHGPIMAHPACPA